MNLTVRITRQRLLAVLIVGGALLAALFLTGAAQTLIERADKGPIAASAAPTSGVGVAIRSKVGSGANTSFIGLGLIGLYVLTMALLIALWPRVLRVSREFNEARRLVRARGGAKPLPVQRSSSAVVRG
jgi:hypothetical protein